MSIRTTSAPPGNRRVERVEDHRGGVGAGGVGDDVAPARSAQMRSWSLAAARNVSAAASSTRRPAAASRAASLPMVVVLPVPFTPTISTTAGAPSGRASAHGGSRGSEERGELATHRGGGAVARAVDRRARSTTLRRERRADVAGDQALLDVVPRLRGDRVADEQPAQPGHEPATAAAQAVLELAGARVGAGHAACRGPDAVGSADPTAPRARARDERSASAVASSSRRLITRLTESSPTVTPYIASAASIVPRLWVMTMHCVCARRGRGARR